MLKTPQNHFHAQTALQVGPTKPSSNTWFLCFISCLLKPNKRKPSQGILWAEEAVVWKPGMHSTREGFQRPAALGSTGYSPKQDPRTRILAVHHENVLYVTWCLDSVGKPTGAVVVGMWVGCRWEERSWSDTCEHCVAGIWEVPFSSLFICLTFSAIKWFESVNKNFTANTVHSVKAWLG